jgi:hypothetical protein
MRYFLKTKHLRGSESGQVTSDRIVESLMILPCGGRKSFQEFSRGKEARSTSVSQYPTPCHLFQNSLFFSLSFLSLSLSQSFSLWVLQNQKRGKHSRRLMRQVHYSFRLTNCHRPSVPISRWKEKKGPRNKGVSPQTLKLPAHSPQNPGAFLKMDEGHVRFLFFFFIDVVLTSTPIMTRDANQTENIRDWYARCGRFLSVL